MKSYKLNDNILFLLFENKIEQGFSMMRFQEYYESGSNKFRNKVFSHEDFIVYYCENQEDKYFSYHEDFVGFNTPGFVFDFFLEGHFDPLWNFEKNVLEEVKKFKPNNKYYIITSDKEIINDHFDKFSRVFNHELHHALYNLSSSYKRKVNKILDKIEDKNIIKQIEIGLKSLGYCKKVFKDETIAFISDYGKETLNFFYDYNIEIEEKYLKSKKVKKILSQTKKEFLEEFSKEIKNIKIPKEIKKYLKDDICKYSNS